MATKISSVIFCLLAVATANASVLITTTEPRGGYQALADYEFYLETPDRLSELEGYFRPSRSGQIRQTNMSCNEPGWFAGAKGRVERGVQTDIFRSSIGAVCGASSKSAAADKALDLCESRAPSGVTCQLDFVKYDPGTISFLNQYRPASDGSGGYVFKPRNAGANDTSQFGCCHGKYAGLDQATGHSTKRASTPNGNKAHYSRSKTYALLDLAQLEVALATECFGPQDLTAQDRVENHRVMGRSISTIEHLEKTYRGILASTLKEFRSGRLGNRPMTDAEYGRYARREIPGQECMIRELSAIK